MYIYKVNMLIVVSVSNIVTSKVDWDGLVRYLNPGFLIDIYIARNEID